MDLRKENISKNNEPKASSPSSSGPAGPFLEGQVGAHYLLTMLAEANPRGLPGMKIQRIEFQRASEGHPLDDVIVHGIMASGESSILEVQVKRTISFTPSDLVFKAVVEQLAQAFVQLDQSHEHHQFAVATERTSFKITGPYQDVLRWAREVSPASAFIERINRPKVSSTDMRIFVDTVRTHLASAGCTNDDETVWQILRRLQILVFDYDAPGSQSTELAVERARQVLEPEEATRASAFWKVLIEIALQVDTSGGDLDRARLIKELTQVDGFRIRGSWRHQAPRKVLAEAASLAASDLRHTIAGVTLSRSVQLDAVRKAQDLGRYIEIRGGPGVGKSGILSMLVQQSLTEARVIVLSPDRVIAGGWLAFKTTLGINLDPKEFLADLASDGGATLFIDSLDFFDDSAKRLTVIDLVRTVAEIPNFQVIVTARTDFDKDEPNWLPVDALTKLGRVTPVVIEDLGTEEIEELKAAAPSLSALLANNHPARAIARNLFRLSRLLEIQDQKDTLRSEIDLLDRWWSTADGRLDGARERKRLLADLSDAVLAGADHIETRASSEVVDALLASETLRELGLDRLTFRHDVLREWSVAARLHDNPTRLGKLPLSRPAPASLARSVELGARFALERAENGDLWVNYLNQVSIDGAHPSWRRWSLLAILRSELADTLLNRAATSLFAQNGALLQELIRTAIATESRLFNEVWVKCGIDENLIPSGIFGPSNSSWITLTLWLLERQTNIPVQMLPDVVDLFHKLSMSMLCQDPFTPKIADVLANWLEELEGDRKSDPLTTNHSLYTATFNYQDIHQLTEDIRQAFLMMASRVPERAQQYLKGVLKRPHSDKLIRSLMKFRGTLAQAAPAELVEITIAGLTPKSEKQHHHRESTRDETFTYLNNIFLPCSPTQGPFLELLNASPKHGLELIRRLVSHAITVKASRREHNDDGITLVLPSGSRFFPWERTYYWSRNADGYYAIESGLMALEAWSHARIEKGDSPDQVIEDILGPIGSPAAFVLVAVDILISHWPKTMDVIIPFLGSPELLVLDLSRVAHDTVPKMDMLGWDEIGPKEPAGSVKLADLKARISRRAQLDKLLGDFALSEGADHYKLQCILEDASLRLGKPEPGDDFGYPRFMARHALNATNPTNWHSKDGRFVYISPHDEAQHISDIRAKHAAKDLDFQVDTAIQNALEDKNKSNPELAEYAVAYAKRMESIADVHEDALRSRTNAIAAAAMIAARDGTDQFLSMHESWVRKIFAKVFEETKRDSVRGMRDSIRYNPIAIATLGLIYLWQRKKNDIDRDALLVLAGRDSAEAAQGFGAGIEVIHEMDRRMIPAALRCALTAQIQPNHEWDASTEKKNTDKARYQERLAARITAERAWLSGEANEPAWPLFPPRAIYLTRGLRIGIDKELDLPSTEPDHTDESLLTQSAALWTRQLTRKSNPQDLSWLVSFVYAYSNWTANANGAGLAPQAEFDNRLDEWNSIYFRLLSNTFLYRQKDEVVAEVRRAITVPDKPFFDICSELIRSVDALYFNNLGFDLETALLVRSLVADRLMASRSWQREHNQSELTVGMHIGPAIGVIFFNDHTAFGETKCYLLEKGIDHVGPFLPQLTQLIESGSVPFTARLTMNLLDVSPRSEHVEFFLSNALTWLCRQPNNTRLWVDNELGIRLVKWLEAVTKTDSTFHSSAHSMRPQMSEMLARLVKIGVADAYRLEQKLDGGLQQSE